MSEDRVRVGATLKALREAQGWTTEKFSEALGIARPTLANIEGGRKRLTPDKAIRAAEILNVPLAAIVSPAVSDPVAAARPGVAGDDDCDVIDLGDAGTIEITLRLRLLQMDQRDVNAILEKLSELRDLGARIAAGSTDEAADAK